MPSILLTRPAPASDRFAAELRAALGDVEIIASPLLRIEWRAAALPGGTPIFTSRHGVEGFLRAGGATGGPCWCVGDATAEVAAKAGFQPRSARGDAAALVELILSSGEKGPFLHVRGAHARGDVAARLRAAGRATVEAVVYDQVAQDLNDAARACLKRRIPVILPLFSPRSAGEFARQHNGIAPLFVAAISEAVRQALGGLDVARVVVAARPDAESMAEAVTALFDAALQLEGARGAK